MAPMRNGLLEDEVDDLARLVPGDRTRLGPGAPAGARLLGIAHGVLPLERGGLAEDEVGPGGGRPGKGGEQRGRYEQQTSKMHGSLRGAAGARSSGESTRILDGT